LPEGRSTSDAVASALFATTSVEAWREDATRKKESRTAQRRRGLFKIRYLLGVLRYTAARVALVSG
jgi:hypothetical protein